MAKRITQNIIIVILLSIVVFSSFIVNTIMTEKNSSKKQKERLVITNNGIMLNKTDYYVALDDIINLDISNPYEASYELIIEDESIVATEEGVLKAVAIGSSEFIIKINGFQAFSGTIHVLNGLVIPKDSFDKSKKFITCDAFTEEENDLLDAALSDRINKAGEQTRAGAVAAARFLTLEFAYRIPYFYENGRLNNYGEIAHVDGEGRYYHKGLYLSSSRYKDISHKFTGPGTWGCKIKQYQDEPAYGFVPLGKYPNGFDCSGFISWVLYNGGFDVKDSGAGDIISRTDDLYDLGEKNFINNTLLDSGNVKVGDLIAYSGHMAIIAGMDEQGNYYVAESLPQFKGVVLNKYTRSSLKATFTHIMLMDSVYKEDGNLTNMWY